MLRCRPAHCTRSGLSPFGRTPRHTDSRIHGDYWDLTCIDRETGKLVYFDAEEIEYGGWKKSFREEADSLEPWLMKWLGGPGLHRQAME